MVASKDSHAAARRPRTAVRKRSRQKRVAPRRGRPSHQPTKKSRAEVEALASYGVPQAEIAKLLAITEPTLRKHYRPQLDLAEIKANAMVAQSLYSKAIGGNVSAQIFWLKTRARWKPPVEPAVPGETDYERARRVRPQGKKEAAAEAASKAGIGTAWDDDLTPPPSALRN